MSVLAPNLLLVWFPPSTPLPSASVSALKFWLERTGQALCMVVPAITAPGLVIWWWLLPAVAALACYYLLWGRYLTTGRHTTDLFRTWCGLPVPMAILPVTTFLAAAAWLSNPWIAVAALVLAAGHIPTAVLSAKAVGATGAEPTR